LSILEDGELLRQVEELIHQNLGAEKASSRVVRVAPAVRAHARPMLRERVGDLIMCTSECSRYFSAARSRSGGPSEGIDKILVTHDSLPAHVQLDREAIIASQLMQALVLRTSRSCPLAGITRGGRPARSDAAPDGSEHVILDGSTGILIINPTPPS